MVRLVESTTQFTVVAECSTLCFQAESSVVFHHYHHHNDSDHHRSAWSAQKLEVMTLHFVRIGSYRLQGHPVDPRRDGLVLLCCSIVTTRTRALHPKMRAVLPGRVMNIEHQLFILLVEWHIKVVEKTLAVVPTFSRSRGSSRSCVALLDQQRISKEKGGLPFSTNSIGIGGDYVYNTRTLIEVDQSGRIWTRVPPHDKTPEEGVGPAVTPPSDCWRGTAAARVAPGLSAHLRVRQGGLKRT